MHYSSLRTHRWLRRSCSASGAKLQLPLRLVSRSSCKPAQGKPVTCTWIAVGIGGGTSVRIWTAVGESLRSARQRQSSLTAATSSLLHLVCGQIALPVAPPSPLPPARSRASTSVRWRQQPEVLVSGRVRTRNYLELCHCHAAPCHPGTCLDRTAFSA